MDGNKTLSNAGNCQHKSQSTKNANLQECDVRVAVNDYVADMTGIAKVPQNSPCIYRAQVRRRNPHTSLVRSALQAELVHPDTNS